VSTLWLPRNVHDRAPKVGREHIQGTREWEALVLSMMHQAGGILNVWNDALRDIDRNLRLMQATEGAHAPGVLPGFYHLVRLRDPAEGTFMWVQPLAGPDGEFVTPTDQMLQDLRARDLQNPAAVADRRRADMIAASSKARSRANEDEDRVHYAVDLFKARTRTQVSMNRQTPWAQNHAGTRRPTRGGG
jgi:hypothetical protein